MGSRPKLSAPSRRWIAILTVSLLSVACGAPGSTVRREGQPDVKMVDSSDPEMVAAQERARETLPAFVALIRTPDPRVDDLTLKVRVEERGAVEHLWLTELLLQDSLIVGVLANRPLSIRKIAEGDTVRAKPSEVSDWMVIREGVLLGGFSVRLLRSRMSAAERARFDADVGFRIVDSLVVP